MNAKPVMPAGEWTPQWDGRGCNCERWDRCSALTQNIPLPPTQTPLSTHGGFPRDASEGVGPERRPQRRVGRRLEEVAKTVGGGYCRLQMPLKLAFGVRETVAGHRRGTWGEGGGLPTRRNVTHGVTPPPFQ